MDVVPSDWSDRHKKLNQIDALWNDMDHEEYACHANIQR